MQTQNLAYDAIVIGSSAGGLDALGTILEGLKEGFPVPLIVVQHISPESELLLISYLNEIANFEVTEAEDKEKLKPHKVYFAPPNYHLMVEDQDTLCLSNEAKINYSRPSIDVLFETAAWSFQNRLIGIVLTGANEDGSKGLLAIKQRGGICIVQDPKSASSPRMPEAAIRLVNPDYVLDLGGIVDLLNNII